MDVKATVQGSHQFSTDNTTTTAPAVGGDTAAPGRRRTTNSNIIFSASVQAALKKNRLSHTGSFRLPTGRLDANKDTANPTGDGLPKPGMAPEEKSKQELIKSTASPAGVATASGFNPPPVVRMPTLRSAAQRRAAAASTVMDLLKSSIIPRTSVIEEEDSEEDEDDE